MNIKEFIFNTYKDQVVIGKTFKRKIIKKYNLTITEASDLFTRINNYQINKYGERLSIRKKEYTLEELNKISLYARIRKHQRRNYER